MIAFNSELRRIPTTVVCGMHGSGKTTVIQQFLVDYKGGPVAMAVVQPTAFNFDAGLLRGLSASLGRKDDLVCEIREDDIEHFWPKRLGAFAEECASASKYEHLLVELGGGCAVGDALDELEAVRNVVCVIDALELLQEAQGKSAEGSISGSADEAASIILAKADLLTDAEVGECVRYIQQEQENAPVAESEFGEIGTDFLTNDVPLPELIDGKTEAIEPGPSVLFSARRPFHPQRFHDLCFGDWPGIWRVKGFFWLATRMELVGGFSLTSTNCSSGPGGQWWATVPRENWPADEALLGQINVNWKEPYGDRRQELVIVGEADSIDPIMDRLEKCLLTDEEMELGPVAWQKFDDPFPSWNEST